MYDVDMRFESILIVEEIYEMLTVSDSSTLQLCNYVFVQFQECKMKKI